MNMSSLQKLISKENPSLSIRLFGEEKSNNDFYANVPCWCNTGCELLDYAISPRGLGIPGGRLVELHGEESHGKSALLEVLIKTFQETYKNGTAILSDSEHAFSPERARKIGVDLSRLVYIQIYTVEEVFSVLDDVIRGTSPQDPIFFGWDSIAGTSTIAEMEGDVGDEQARATHARLLAKGLRRIVGGIGDRQFFLVVTNQLKTNLGVMFGQKLDTFGGKAIKYHASVRLHIKRELIKDGKTPVGMKCKVRVVKNKVAPPLKEIEFVFKYDSGIDNVESIYLALNESKMIGTGSTKSLTVDYPGKKPQTIVGAVEIRKALTADKALRVWAIQKVLGTG